MKTELQTFLPELNANQMEWLESYIKLEIAKAERALLVKLNSSQASV